MLLVRTKYTRKRKRNPYEAKHEKKYAPISGVVCWDRQVREKYADRLNSLVQVVIEMRNFSIGGKEARGRQGIQMQCKEQSPVSLQKKGTWRNLLEQILSNFFSHQSTARGQDGEFGHGLTQVDLPLVSPFVKKLYSL
jgi:hypothetical protein